jgi:hypothetical protein
VVIAFVAAFPLSGSPVHAARTTEMYRMEPRPHFAADGGSDEQKQGAINEAIEAAGWQPHVHSDRLVGAYISVRGGKHTANVEIEFDERTYVVRYVTSYNLGHDENYCRDFRRSGRAGAPKRPRRLEECSEIIHPDYNEWVHRIEDAILRYVALLRPGMAARSIPAPAVKPAPTPATMFVADELLKLKILRDDGVLTEEEFETQKSKLLGRDATRSR